MKPLGNNGKLARFKRVQGRPGDRDLPTTTFLPHSGARDRGRDLESRLRPTDLSAGRITDELAMSLPREEASTVCFSGFAVRNRKP
jgi:hypothetical protein